jgi:hypothetical protein
MKKLTILLYPMIVLVISLGFGVNSLADGFEVPALANNTISEPINILVIGFGLIALGSFIKRGSRRSE